jgi:hypothetical protein
MSVSKICNTLLPGLALLVATTAFAANKANKGSINLDRPTTVIGHQLAPGEYKLTWDRTGSNVDLMILSHGKLVATVPAHLIEMSIAQPFTTTEFTTNGDGSQSLTKVDFGGKKYALAFGDVPAAESASQGSSQ